MKLLNSKALIAFLGCLTVPLLFLIPGHRAEGGEATTVRSNGERIYMSNCEACHMLGTNVIKPDKELVTSEKIASRTIFKNFIGKKHGVMPSFSEIADDDRNVKDLYTFVRKLKQQTWTFPLQEPESKDPEPKEPQPPGDAQ